MPCSQARPKDFPDPAHAKIFTSSFVDGNKSTLWVILTSTQVYYEDAAPSNKGNTIGPLSGRHVRGMDPSTEGAMEGDTDSRVATLERKRPYDPAIGDGNSNAGSVTSTPRKRAKYTGKLGHQDVRDFVPNGASFSSSALPFDDVSASEGESVQLVASIKNKEVEDDDFYHVSEDDTPIKEGRRLYIGNLSANATVEDVRKFFSGYSMYVLLRPYTMNIANIYPQREHQNSPHRRYGHPRATKCPKRSTSLRRWGHREFET